MTESKKTQEQNAPAILINSQYIKDFSLEIPFAPEIFGEIKTNPDLHIDVEVTTRNLKENFFETALSFKINGEVNNKKLFILELVYAGVAALNVPEEHREAVLMIELPRLLFPFARSVITNVLVEGGLPPFMLSPIDFVALYQNRKAAEENK